MLAVRNTRSEVNEMRSIETLNSISELRNVLRAKLEAIPGVT